MAKIQIKSEKLTPFGGIFSIMEQFDSTLSSVINSTLGLRCRSFHFMARFHQKDTLKRFFERFEQNGLTINYFSSDCGSCSEEIIICYFNGDVSRMAPKI